MHGNGFHEYILATGVANYIEQPGCTGVRLWRRDINGWAHFLLLSERQNMTAIRAFPGDTPESAILYPEDDLLELVPDTVVSHDEVLDLTPMNIE